MKFCGLIFLMFITGCGPRIPSLPTKGQVFGNPVEAFHPSGDAAKDQNDAEAQSAFWKAKAEVFKEQGERDRKRERQQWLERICRWVIGLCFIGVLLNVALFILSFKFDWFGKLRVVAFAGVMANLAIICLVWFIPAYIGWVAGVVVAGAGLTMIYLIRNNHGLGCEIHKASQSASDAVTALVKRVG